jgi:Domain of unknown function (DUF1937)
MEARFQAATRAAATLVKKGYVVYSPITMTHPMDKLLATSTNTLGSDFWVKFDEAFMSACSSMCVLTLDGWEDSSGIRREIEFFSNQNKAVVFVDDADVVPENTKTEKPIKITPSVT